MYDFLEKNNVTATHFMIGQNIMWYPDIFMQAYNNGGDIAVHTWTHPHMTNQTNEVGVLRPLEEYHVAHKLVQGVLAELGWTMKIIHDSTGGRLPRYWRPPYVSSALPPWFDEN